jgi:flagellar basal-body rod modification protein FlgD
MNGGSMNINPIGLNSTLGQTAPAAAASKGEDRETFLKLLVAQLKNQDPLAPQDGAQFVAQLAQFSALDQLININEQLGELLKRE